PWLWPDLLGRLAFREIAKTNQTDSSPSLRQTRRLNHDLVRAIGAATLASDAKIHCSLLFTRGAQLDGNRCYPGTRTSAIAAHTSACAAARSSPCCLAAAKSGSRTNESRFRSFSRRTDSIAIAKSKHRRRGRL